MIKGVVFDMDGLMFDTERLAVESWLYAGEKTGWNMRLEVIEETIGVDTKGTCEIFMREFGETFDFTTTRNYRLEYVERYLAQHGLPVKSGLYELLDYLQKGGYKIAVASSSPAKMILRFFNLAGVVKYFDQIVGGDMIERGKPAPDIFLLACEKLKLEPRHCLALEDSPAGILASSGAGMRAIMIPDIARPGERLKDVPYVKLDSLSDVIGYLEQSKKLYVNVHDK